MTEPAAPDTLDSAIAVIGMSGRFPGAPDLAAYWQNLLAGVVSVTDFTEAELLADGADPAQVAGRDHVPSKGVLEGADRFEPALFGFNRTEAAVLDPQHRLLLETAWSALEDAGLNPLGAPARTGVYVGGGVTEHMLAAQTDPALAAQHGALQARILTDREFLAPWISYRLGLDGPSLTVQTACSTSLSALHLACQALLLGDCDTALAGGVAVDSVRRRGYVHYEGGIFSADGRCRPFDEASGGTVPGNGVGVVVLRRLADALADGDPIRAVVRGSAVTNDGAARVGFTAPGVDQQTAAIREAWASAGLDPADAQYLEAHGTATRLGDRIEASAAGAAFAGAGTGAVALGSVKANLGHLDAAAGVAGVIKTVLMLEHGVIAPTAGAGRPNPELGLADSPFHVVTEAEPWPEPAGGPRRAGVSSVGIGGTNVHVVLEQAPPRTPAAGAPPEPEALLLAAHSEDALRALAGRLAAALRGPAAPDLADVARTLREGRAPLAVRAYVVASDRAEAAARLDGLVLGRPAAHPGDPAGPRALGEAWLRGELPDGPDRGRRVSLPGYPFAGESFGALSLDAVRAPAGAVDAPQDAGPDAGPDAGVRALIVETLGLAGEQDMGMTYFAAGGDSLAAVHLVGCLRDDFGLDVPLTLFLEELTLDELARRIVEAGSPDDALDALLSEFENV
ncbi:MULTISPECIES: beta-ketoacyl synthase N-terminal-like domain-containing protein [Streptomyces]|uniref:Phosphopantetheine-binding protein n=1 Tax=Streptomyces drozdowiczii TaxID=202862 RepID=A0ABY6PNX9_9ACTN|nr:MULTISPECIES: beta-ketoacyl synthase N-terminal-like domain-containing protein [Streptomyces]MCX0246619.1 phosphopantetheine-binding protein [Streptomyces drozdowiczii]UZK53903.1 phosphopantetheine-binding protein [Streptomyces drozdowiczii]